MAITASTLVPTPDGWERADNIFKGSYLFDERGQVVQVKGVQTYTPQDCYEVTFEDGLTVLGDKHLTFHMQDRKWRNRLGEYINRKNRTKTLKMSRPLIELDCESLSSQPLVDNNNRIIYSVPNCLPVQYPIRDLPVPPYIFGVWFATKSPTGRHWVRDRPIEKMKKVFRSYGHFIKTSKHKNGDVLFDIRPSVHNSFLFAGLDIPTSLPFYYLDGSVSQRIELLEGFIDSGFIKKHKTTTLYIAKNANYKLMRKIQGLVESLGVKTELHLPKIGHKYTLKFRIKSDLSVLFGTNRRFVTKITKIPAQPCVHIETDTQFLIGEGFIPVC